MENDRYYCFDPLRHFLALFIIIWHAVEIASGPLPLGWQDPLQRMVAFAILPMFFCLSGFLVMGSALRLKSLRSFIFARLLRIIPALTVEVILCAVVLGAAMTSLPLDVYFKHPQFLSYFGNIVGHVQFYLPGVFQTGNYKTVNVNLWTLVPEFYCYGLMIALIVFRLQKYKISYLILFIFATTVFIHQSSEYLLGRDGIKEHRLAGLHARPEELVYIFFLGTLLYLYKQEVPKHFGLFGFCFITYVFIAFSFLPIPMLYLPLIAYCTFYIGTLNFRMQFSSNFFHRNDYSYGMYLYGFPITQTLWYNFPILRDPLSLTISSIVVTLIFSSLSWRLIEKPALKLKDRLK